MAGKKYVSDYRVEKAITPSGKVETRLFYQGIYYRYERSREEILRLRRHILLVTVLSALLIFPLFTISAMLSHIMYVVLPAAFSLIPMYLLLAGARRLGFADEKFTREHRDKTEKRISRGSLWLTIFLGMAVVGCVVYTCLFPVVLEEILSMASLLLALAGSVTLLPHRKKAKAVEIEA